MSGVKQPVKHFKGTSLVTQGGGGGEGRGDIFHLNRLLTDFSAQQIVNNKKYLYSYLPSLKKKEQIKLK